MGKACQNECCNCGGNGARAATVAAKLHQRAASPRGTACPDSSHFRLTTCRYPINPTNPRAAGKMKPCRLHIWCESDRAAGQAMR